MTTVAAALADGRRRLSESATPGLDGELLLARLLGRHRPWLHAHAEAELEPSVVAAFDALVARRAAGEPMAYILGRREFWSLELEVTPAVLIPRPETELLVEAALAHLRDCPRAEPAIADLGTGSGCVAVALARERPGARIVAVDGSAEALAVARRNADRHGTRNTDFVRADWAEALARGRFDVIATNPPYVATGDPHLRCGDLRFEPAAALDGGADGLATIRRIAAGAAPCLRAGGLIAIEHAWDQGEAVAELLCRAGLTDLALWHDGAGLGRVTTALRPPARYAT